MRHNWPNDVDAAAPRGVSIYLRRAARVSVGDLDALATVEARRRLPGGWSAWEPVVGLLDGDGAIWCGAGGSVIELRASEHTALTIEDGLRAADLPRKAAVAAALEWLGLSTTGTRAELDARLEAAP